MDMPIIVGTVAFAEWRFDPQGRTLSRRDAACAWLAVPIGSRAVEILALLLEQPGALVTKATIMARVWPETVVEPNNLTVQIAALRRVIDEGRDGDSLIQTVPGRGYRFAGLVEPEIDAPVAATAALPRRVPAGPPGQRRDPSCRPLVGALALAAAVALLLGVAGRLAWPARAVAPPLVAVLPFEALDGFPAETTIAAQVTQNLTDGLSGAPLVSVAAPGASRALAGQDADARRIGRDLGVRYVVSGSVRATADVARVSARLVSTETNALVWADSIDVPATDPNAGTAATARVFVAAYREVIAAEATRGAREQQRDPTAADLLLLGRSLSLQPPSPARSAETRTLFERAVTRDPSSGVAQALLIDHLLDDEDANPRGRKMAYDRATTLLAGLSVPPGLSWLDASIKLHWLSWQHVRCRETVTAGRQIIARYAWMTQAYRWLGDCLSRTGQAEDAVSVLNEAVRLGQDDPYQSRNYRNLQYALLLLARYDESIGWGERALAANPVDSRWLRAQLLLRLAAAHALSDRLDTARRRLADALRLMPYVTLRDLSPGEAADAVYAAQVARVREGLRRAGLREHADEAADFGTAADDVIHQEFSGPTPRTAPGVVTIATDDLIALLARQKPVLIDTMWNLERQSIPGAVGLRYAGDGGDLSDPAQARLGVAMRLLTRDDLAVPVVAIGGNAETFGGRNLALRLVKLGYSRVYWYRGGREAWEVRALPEADLVVRDW